MWKQSKSSALLCSFWLQQIPCLHTSHTGLTCCIVPHTVIHVHTQLFTHTDTHTHSRYTQRPTHRDPHIHTQLYKDHISPGLPSCLPLHWRCDRLLCCEEVGDILPEVEDIRLVCPPLPKHIFNWNFFRNFLGIPSMHPSELWRTVTVKFSLNTHVIPCSVMGSSHWKIKT